MEKWSEEKIRAYIQFVEDDKQELRRWELRLKNHPKDVKRAEEVINHLKNGLAHTLKELSEQGIYL